MREFKNLIQLNNKNNSSRYPNSKVLSSKQQVHKPHFEWCYKAINYDLTRSFSYRNLIALILHQIWIWICNQLYSEEKLLDSTLDYDNILKKWYKSASLEYIKKIKNFKIASSKDTLSICDRNNYIKI
ncbi:hypothetical protein ACTFIZ_000379 [Dictyostelium cf. discoideum]